MSDLRKLKLEELGRIDVPAFKKRSKIPVIVVLDNIRSGLNVGAFFRTSDAFAVQRIILTGICPRPPHKEILKSAIGATKSMDWSYESDIGKTIKQLAIQDYEIIGIEQTTESIALSDYLIDDAKKFALVFGNEVEGLSEETLRNLDVAIEVPQFGTKHSLNVSVCAGIVIWEFMKGLKINLK